MMNLIQNYGWMDTNLVGQKWIARKNRSDRIEISFRVKPHHIFFYLFIFRKCFTNAKNDNMVITGYYHYLFLGLIHTFLINRIHIFSSGLWKSIPKMNLSQLVTLYGFDFRQKKRVSSNWRGFKIWHKYGILKERKCVYLLKRSLNANPIVQNKSHLWCSFICLLLKRLQVPYDSRSLLQL